MKTQLILAASIALAFAGPALAQDSYSNQPAQPDQSTPMQADQPAPATEQTDQPTTAEQNETAEPPSKQMSPVEEQRPVVQNRSPRRHCATCTFTIAESVAPVISEKAPQPVAANTYDPRRDALTKVYPTVDRGHVEGDPPIIDHSADIAPVTPTDSIALVPSDD